MAKIGLVALAVWVAAAVAITVLALSPGFSAYGELRPIIVPLSPATWERTGVTHLGLVQTPGRLWAVVSDRDGRLTRAIVIHVEISKFSAEDREYVRPTEVRFVIPAAHARWYDVHSTEGDAQVLAELAYGHDTGGKFEVRVGGRSLAVPGNPTFPATAVRGVIAELVTPDLRDQLVTWCEIGQDLGRVSRHHDTYQSALATRVGNVLSALCCMSDGVGCSTPP